MIHVLLIDDQTLVRSGIRGLIELSGRMKVVGEASNGHEALHLIRQQAADVVLLDIRMPLYSGIEVLKTLKASGHPHPPILLLTTFDDDHALLEGMRAGAKGFLLKDISLERLTDAIEQVAAGKTLFRPAVTQRVLEKLSPTGTDAAKAPDVSGAHKLGTPFQLTTREKEILSLMAGGFSNREIADALGPSEGTIKNHVSNILSKLGVKDRVRAVLKGFEMGHL